MKWAQSYYDRTGEWWGASMIRESDRERAATIERLCGAGARHVLELGAGFGGTAAAMADLGHSVVAVELSPVRIRYARQLASEPRKGSFTLVEGDFYEVDIRDTFDVICYWNGFGIGSDAEQRILLHRIATNWMEPGSCLLMNVYSAWWWIRRAGMQEFKPPFLVQGYDFDPIGCRFIDKWWPVHNQQEMISENIRCYSPVDFLLLLEGTGLKLDVIEIDGKSIDMSRSDYTIDNPLWDTWKYFVKLIPNEQ